MKKQYNTKQRELLISFFKSNPDQCFTAKEIISNSKLDIGEATIYRTLNKLSDEGIIKKFISDGSSGSIYQLHSSHGDDCHIHLKCLKCGKIFHMDCPCLADVEKHIEKNHNFSVDNSKTILYGVCKDCK